MASLALSGITAFPLVTELEWLGNHKNWFPSVIQDWISKVHDGVVETGTKYPFISYGTDWLAFAHIVIALAFIGPLRDPVRNKWVVDWGIINCVLIFPLAFIAGSYRDIPFFHQVIDCSFGVIGLIPLIIARLDIIKLEKIQTTYSTNYS
jgi:hypothetical protein